MENRPPIAKPTSSLDSSFPRAQPESEQIPVPRPSQARLFPASEDGELPDGTFDWLARLTAGGGDLLGRSTAGRQAFAGRTLVLCRTMGQVQSLRRLLVRRGGGLGVRVATLESFCASIERPDDVREEGVSVSQAGIDLPAGRALLTVIGDRPRLKERACAWALHVRLHKRAGGGLDGVPGELVDLAEMGFGASEGERAVVSLLKMAEEMREEGVNPAEQLGYGRVYSLGFPALDLATGSPLGIDPLEQAFASDWLPGFNRHSGVLGAKTPLAPIVLWQAKLLHALAARPLIPPEIGRYQSSSRSRLLIVHPEKKGTSSDPGGYSIPAVAVPDVAAEARLAVRLLPEGPGELSRTLVLVPDAGTAARFHDACVRNGLSAARFEVIPLSRHPLTAVVRTATSWFSGPKDPLIRASHLKVVLASRLLGRRLPGELERTLSSLLQNRGLPETQQALAGAEHATTRLSVRQVVEAVLSARLVEAPLSMWIARLKQLAEQLLGGQPPGTREEFKVARNALLLWVRLRRLAACIAGVPFEDSELVAVDATGTVSGDDHLRPTHIERGVEVVEETLHMGGSSGTGGRTALAEEEPDVQESAVLGEEIDEGAEDEWGDEAVKGERRNAAGTLGAVRRFLLDCGVAVVGDPVAQSIVGMLKEHAASPATPAELAALLASQCATGFTQDGVEVMSYDDYDGRPSSMLILLGVHNKGLASFSGRDPFAGEEVSWQLGELAGQRLVKFRLIQALRAAARSGSAVALLAARDETGRAVVPPVELSLDLEAGRSLLGRLDPPLDARRTASDSFGLSLAGIVETVNRTSLQVMRVRTAEGESAVRFPGPPESNDKALRHLAIQACAEWYRAGKGTGMKPAPDELFSSRGSVHPVTELLEAVSPLCPDWLFPLLGHAGAGVTGRLRPDGNWSVTRHFEPLVQCPYRFFAKTVLGLEEPEEVSDDLLPKEVGNAVHKALEISGKAIPWRVPAGRDVIEERQKVVALLRDNARRQFRSELGKLGEQTVTAQMAAAGLEERWANHWKSYADSRIIGTQDAAAVQERALRASARQLPQFRVVRDLLDQCLTEWAAQRATRMKDDLVARLIVAVARGQLPASLGTDDVVKMASDDGFPMGKVAAGLAQFSTLPQLGQLLWEGADALDEFFPFALVASGTLQGEIAEFAFGSYSTSGEGEVSLRPKTGLEFMGKPLALSGRVDSIRVWSDGVQRALEVADYKSGGVRTSALLEKMVEGLLLPQLPVYAMILNALMADEAGGGLPPDGRVGAMTYDYLKDPSGACQLSVTAGIIDRTRQILSRLIRLVEEGRFACQPHPHVCPVAAGRGAWCFMKGICRFDEHPRSHPAAKGSGEEVVDE